jgi:alkanesulfonate monooxygenase SsuD/methylene tetrahydromethanopterin reductase-like flavin-dependent oxidoreductase (luciferase family)
MWRERSSLMAEYGRLEPRFGVSLTPSARDLKGMVALATLADELGFDYLCIQDHPYNAQFLDTWTLYSLLGGLTSRIRFLPDVLNLPLRPPAMLAKATATIDLLTGGRAEMGLGAGGFWDGVEAYGGPRRTPGEAVDALREAIMIMRALWAEGGGPIDFRGKHYSLKGAQPGPAPAHPIGIWLGALGPRMLRLTGELADGWIVSVSYTPPEKVPEATEAIDEAAVAAGRQTTDIRRGYNVGGVILQPGGVSMRPARPGVLVGTPGRWVEELTRYYLDLRMDTFIFWPAGGDEERQIRSFAEDVVPGVRAAVAST